MNRSSSEHTDRTSYPSLVAALTDADAVAVDLIATVQGQLLVPAADIDFLARRLRQLVLGCIRAAYEEAP